MRSLSMSAILTAQTFDTWNLPIALANACLCLTPINFCPHSNTVLSISAIPF